MKKISAAVFAISYVVSYLATASQAHAKHSKKQKNSKEEKVESLMFDENKNQESSQLSSSESEKKFNTFGEYAEARLFKLKNDFHAASSISKSEVGTSGHYVGLNVIKSSIGYHEVDTRDNWAGPRLFAGSSDDNNYGVGLNYKYAFNFDGVFIAPGVFFEKPNASTSNSSGFNKISTNNRYGLSADLGYDVTDRIAPYLTGGLSEISYQTKNYGSIGGVVTTSLKKATVFDWYYGAGVKIKFNRNLSFGLEYNTQKFDAKTTVLDTKNLNSTYKTRLNLVKFGVFYNF